MIIVIVSILIFLALVYVFQTRIQHKSYSNIFGFTAFRVATGSMENTIEVGDIVITKLDTPVNLNDIIKSNTSIKAGDKIYYTHMDKSIALFNYNSRWRTNNKGRRKQQRG